MVSSTFVASDGFLVFSVSVDFSALDDLTASCGYAEDLESDTEECRFSEEVVEALFGPVV